MSLSPLRSDHCLQFQIYSNAAVDDQGRQADRMVLWRYWTAEQWDREITFSVSAKLPCSGEKWEEAILPEVVCEYEKRGTAYLKFVIATEQDFADAECAIGAYRAAGFKGHVYLMPVGGVESVYTLNNKNVALIAMKNGLRYSDRLQVPLFKNEWGT